MTRRTRAVSLAVTFASAALGVLAFLPSGAAIAAVGGEQDAGSGNLVGQQGAASLDLGTWRGNTAASAGTPTGVTLVAANSTQEIADLAAKGRALVRRDELASELRRRQGRGAGQFGFDVGIGVAKGQTLPGPGKDKVGDTLSPAERQGFDIAVLFTLERNRNAKLAAVGANIARRDPDVQEARTADRDVFYWLGFDIATGIFGDPAHGAQGNTATGPGSLKIRDSLSAAGRRGFNDAVTFHLNRAY